MFNALQSNMQILIIMNAVFIISMPVILIFGIIF